MLAFARQAAQATCTKRSTAEAAHVPSASGKRSDFQSQSVLQSVEAFRLEVVMLK